MKFNGTKAIPWKFFVPILQVFKYFSWWCHKGEFLVRKALWKTWKTLIFHAFSCFSNYLLKDLHSYYLTTLRISWWFEDFHSLKNTKNIDFTKISYLLNHLHDVTGYNIQMLVKRDKRIFAEWFWYHWNRLLKGFQLIIKTW